MAKFKPMLDIWELSDEKRAALQPGQWVYAGERDNFGRFYGQGERSSVTVVAWRGNYQGRFRTYTKAIRDYAATVR